MKKIILVALVSVLAGFAGGYVVADKSLFSDKDEAEHTHQEGHDHAQDSMHSHGSFEVSAEEAPSIDFTVEEDAKSGWNITIKIDKFKFAPGNVNQENVLGEGHAHLYVDNEKIARIYSTDFHYDGKFDGTKDFRITLNANDHSEYTVNGNTIEANQPVNHPAHD